MLIMHDYSALLEATSHVLSFSGYLDKEDEKEKDKAEVAFTSAVRGFVFDALKRHGDVAYVRSQVLAELDAMEREQGPCMGEFAVLRSVLPGELSKQGGMGRIGRLVRRWAPTVLGVIGVLTYLALKGFDFLFFLG